MPEANQKNCDISLIFHKKLTFFCEMREETECNGDNLHYRPNVI